jgi:hypothetical protein
MPKSVLHAKCSISSIQFFQEKATLLLSFLRDVAIAVRYGAAEPVGRTKFRSNYAALATMPCGSITNFLAAPLSKSL